MKPTDAWVYEVLAGDKPAPTTTGQMRFIPKFANGTWSVFDTEFYGAIDAFRDSPEAVFPPRKVVAEICERMNARA